MAFTPETGLGVAGANAYITEAFADTYHADRGFTAWAFSDTAGLVAITSAQKQAAIIRATDHIDRVYGPLFRGWKATEPQGLDWPRTSAWDPNGYALLVVPANLQNATAEYALRALLQGVLTPDPPPKSPVQPLTQGSAATATGGGSGVVQSHRDKIGPLESETSYDTSLTAQSTLENFPAADMMLRPLLEAKNNEIIRG